eukprot:6189289-Pleurochrysis_carterae.AAC.1
MLFDAQCPQLFKHVVVGRFTVVQAQSPHGVCPRAVLAPHEGVCPLAELLLHQRDEIIVLAAKVLAHHVLCAEEADVPTRKHERDAHQPHVGAVHVS